MFKKIFFIFIKYSGLNFLYGQFSDNKVFIVGYHSIFSRANESLLKTCNYQHISIEVGLFEKQVKFMIDHGHNFIKFEDLARLNDLKIKKPTIIYFDDGFKDNILNVLPILKKYKIPATFFITPKYIDSGDAAYMNWGDVRKLQAEGMEIGSHTYSHAVLTKIDSDALKMELTSSKTRLEKEIGRAVKIFSYPKGRVNPHVVKAVEEAGYQYAVNTEYGANSHEYVLRNPYMLKKVAPRVYERFADFTVRLYGLNLFR